LFVSGASSAHGPGVQGRPPGDAKQPVGQQLFPPDRSGLVSQHQEGRLEAVFGVLAVCQQALADAPDHRPVPPQKHVKGHLIALGDKLLKQVLVGYVHQCVRAERSPEMADNRVSCCSAHGAFLEGSILITVARGLRPYTILKPSRKICSMTRHCCRAAKLGKVTRLAK
jgi:hypothetical protein